MPIDLNLRLNDKLDQLIDSVQTGGRRVCTLMHFPRLIYNTDNAY